MSSFSNQLKTLITLASVGFKFEVDKLLNVNFSVNQQALTGLTLGEATQLRPFQRHTLQVIKFYSKN